jgi:predicted RNA binding protein YcfA (HicA-like mRNA interferase family)
LSCFFEDYNFTTFSPLSSHPFFGYGIEQGWLLKRVSGSHHIYQKPDSQQILSIPVHRNQDLKLGTLKSLMRIANLSEQDLL